MELGVAPRSGAVRAVRALAVGVGLLAAASLAHVAAGGGAAPPATWLVAALAAAVAAWALGGSRLTAAPLLLLTGGAQLLGHLTHVQGAHGSTRWCAQPRGVTAADPTGVFAGVQVTTVCGTPAAEASTSPGLLMLALHAAAAVATALLLAWGEDMLWRLASAVRPVVLPEEPPLVPERVLLLVGPAPAVPSSPVLPGADPRGPPVRS